MSDEPTAINEPKCPGYLNFAYTGRGHWCCSIKCACGYNYVPLEHETRCPDCLRRYLLQMPLIPIEPEAEKPDKPPPAGETMRELRVEEQMAAFRDFVREFNSRSVDPRVAMRIAGLTQQAIWSDPKDIDCFVKEAEFVVRNVRGR